MGTVEAPVAAENVADAQTECDRLRREGVDEDGTPARARGGPSDTSDEDDERALYFRGYTPSYPFPTEFTLQAGAGHIGVIPHLCSGHPSATRTLIIFLPGVHGGVGPCRTPGTNFCERALYPTLAAKLVAEGQGIDCYRCSWPFMRPRINYAVGAVMRVLHHGLMEALGDSAAVVSGIDGQTVEDDTESRCFRVFFVGHSLGGSVALHAVKVAARYFTGKRSLVPGLRGACVSIAGFCTLNGAVDPREADLDEEALKNCRALLVAASGDDIVPPEATAQLFEALPLENKRHLLLEGGSHDLYAYKERLVEELEAFLMTP